jgi:hypothetical protein
MECSCRPKDHRYIGFDLYLCVSLTSVHGSNLGIIANQLCLTSASGLVIWILCCVVVHKYRHQRRLLIKRALQISTADVAA